MTAESDPRWMRRALRLASRGFTPPNPMVGCVVIKDGRIVGEGFHLAAGMPHAEANALRKAGDQSRGATAYVTLEPCCFWGRTPACTDALISSGIKRVVVAHLDPDPRVSGKGVEALRSNGIQVDVGLLANEARAINAPFLYYHAHNSPYTTLKAAISLDGKTAASSGSSQWISSAKSREYVHKLRARSGAVMAGIGTVLADDPRLTARITPEAPRQPLRVIVDSRLRTPVNCSAIQVSTAKAPLLIVTTDQVPANAAAKIEREGVQTLRLPADRGKVDLRSMMSALAERQIVSVLVEGGGELNAALLSSGLVHGVLFFVAPILLGGRCAPTAVEGDGVQFVAEGNRLSNLRARRFGSDYIFEASIDQPQIIEE